MSVAKFWEKGSGVGIEGTVLDSKYRVLRLIGEGGMGAVYEAEHVKVHRHVAVKFLAAELARDVSAVARFQREAEAAGRIGHDNICEVFDFGVGPNGLPYFVMPLLKGRALSAAICEAGRFPPARACDVGAQALSALAEAHAAGIIHRDLKPDNIFLIRVGDREDFVKLLDFGVSKIMRSPTLGGEGGSPPLTKTGSVLGTPAYMSPEQARGLKDIDARVDVYAVGVILYEMLTGHRPFDGETFNEVLWKLWNDPVTPPRAFCSDLSPDLEQVVLRAMSRDREQRHPSASVLREDLLRVAAALRTGAAHPAGTLITVGGSAPAEPAPPTPGSAFSSSVAAPVPGPATLITPGAGSMAPSTEMLLPKRRAPLYVALAVGGVLVAGAAAFFLLQGTDAEPGAAKPPVAVGVRPPPGTVATATAPLPTAPTLSRPDNSSATVSVDPAESAPPTPDGSAAPAPDAGQAGRTEADVPPTPEAVRITLEGVPPGSTITVDGSAVAGPAFDVARADRSLEVVVRAAGFEPWRQRVSAGAAAAIPVRLRRASGAGRTRADAGRGGTADAGTTLAAEPADGGRPRDGRGAVDGTVSQFGAVP
jgi:hypothetical protein